MFQPHPPDLVLPSPRRHRRRARRRDERRGRRGILVTFPALIALGIPPITANATSTVALWPGPRVCSGAIAPNCAGHAAAPSPSRCRACSAGSWAPSCCSRPPSADSRRSSVALPRRNGALHGEGAPPPVAAPAPRRRATSPPRARSILPPCPSSSISSAWACTAATSAPVPGSTLAALGLMGLTNIHQMNGLKSGGGVMNLVAVVIFAVSGIVNWPVALAMAVGDEPAGSAARCSPSGSARRGFGGSSSASAWGAASRCCLASSEIGSPRSRWSLFFAYAQHRFGLDPAARPRRLGVVPRACPPDGAL